MTTAAKKRPKRRKLAWYLRPFKWLLWFVAISVLWVLIYAVVPPPVTFTMLADSNGITKDWTSLSEHRPQHGARGDCGGGRQILLP